MHVYICLLALSVPRLNAKKVQIMAHAMKPADPVVVISTVHGLKAPYQLDLHSSISQNESYMEDEDEDDDDYIFNASDWDWWDNQTEAALEEIEDNVSSVNKNASRKCAKAHDSEDTARTKIEPEILKASATEPEKSKASMEDAVCEEFAGNDLPALFDRFRGKDSVIGEEEKNRFFNALDTCYKTDVSQFLRAFMLRSSDLDYEAFRNAYTLGYDVIQSEFLGKAVVDRDGKRIFHQLVNWSVGRLMFTVEGLEERFPSLEIIKGLNWKETLAAAITGQWKNPEQGKLSSDWNKMLAEAPNSISETEFTNLWRSLCK